MYNQVLKNIVTLICVIIVSASLIDAQNNWSIPACSWSRPMGDYPKGAAGRTRRGIPLGGIGAGNFMYNLCGTFGPWEFKTGIHEEKFLSQAAFHIFEQIHGSIPTVTTLATENILSKWNILPKDSGTYYALYPKAWLTYKTTKAQVILKQFTPVIPHNYKESSYPVGIFQFQVSNPSTDTLSISLMFTFPNAGYSTDKRIGLINHIEKENTITGVVMKAVNSQNVSTTQNTEWCIAAESQPGALVSFCTSWNGNESGKDIYDEFSDDGVLPDNVIDTSNTASALAIKVILPPGSSKVLPFAVSWDFPIVKFNGGTEWYKRYTEYFDFTAGNSFRIAKSALLNRNEWETAVDNWQKLIIDESEYPDWLKQASLNELYYDTFGGVFWENGCITKPAESSYGTLPNDDHKYFCMECNEYSYCETFDVRHYEARHYVELWPEIERDVLKWFADYIYNDPAGSAPHDAGSPGQDPFFKFSGYGSNWQDMPSKFIQQVYAYYNKTHDDQFLDFVWPACRKTYNYMKTHDTNKNGIPDIGNTTYDTWGINGDNLLCGGLWIGALEAMEKMAVMKGETEFSNQLKQEYSISKQNLDTLLWDNNLKYYKIDQSSDAIMADGLNGQRYCETTGLQPILPDDRIVSHLNKVFELCVKPLQDFTGDGIGDVGAVNGRNTDGSSLGYGQPSEVWTGSSYFVAAMMYYRGKILNDAQLKQRALQTAYGVYYQTWVNEQTAYFFNTPEAWNAAYPTSYRAMQYQRPRAIWELLLEIKNPFDSLTQINDDRIGAIPEKYFLGQNYPNPFNPTTNIGFRIANFGFVTLKVYDILGKEIATLVNEEKTAGSYIVKFDGSNLPSGVYFYRLRAGEFLSTKKLIVLK